MKRRGFFAVLAGLPFAGWAAKALALSPKPKLIYIPVMMHLRDNETGERYKHLASALAENAAGKLTVRQLPVPHGATLSAAWHLRPLVDQGGFFTVPPCNSDAGESA